MKLAVLLAAALLLIGCPGNTGQNAPTPSQGRAGRPETPGVAPMSTSAPRSGLNVISVPAATSPGERNLSGPIGAPLRVSGEPADWFDPQPEHGPTGAARDAAVVESGTASPAEFDLATSSGQIGGAPLFARTVLDSQLQTDILIVSYARTGIGTAAGALRGTARWFATGPNGVAAAGPRLRAALGSHWRGTLVGVTYRGKTLWTRLGDFCACGSGSIIDLPDEVFARFAPLSVGVLAVTVHWGDRNVLPATDTLP